MAPRLKENTFPAITPLSYVMWRVRNDDAGDACHGETLTRAGPVVFIVALLFGG